MNTVIEVRTSPHLHSDRSVDMIMRNVVYAMLPICFYSIWLFGLSALTLLAASTGSCILAEHLACKLFQRESSINDYSATITGMLLGLVLPPGLPLWMAAIGGFVAIAPGKMLFGGLGFNVFNPALVGRAFLQAAFPTAIMGYTQPFYANRFTEFIPSTLAWPFQKAASIAAVSSATPLNLQKFDHISTNAHALIWGERAGSLGETCTPLILLCGLYLIVRQMMDWRIPVSMLMSAMFFGSLFYWLDSAKYPDPFVHLLSGGLMLGAVFMATDPVASPVTPLGMWIYGVVMGLLTIVIRALGGLAEGVMYAILLGNALAPMIDNLTQPPDLWPTEEGGGMNSDSFRIIRMLGSISLICAVLIVGVHVNTLEKIKQNQEIILTESISQLLPGLKKQITYGVEPSGELVIRDGSGDPSKRFFAGYDAAGKLLGIVIEGSERGYGDVINAMYSYSPEKKAITGFKVVDMKETPGLGDKIDKDPAFQENFKELDTTHPIVTVKSGKKRNAWEVDAISGATVSSRAVGRLLNKSVQDMVPVIDKNLERIGKGI